MVSPRGRHTAGTPEEAAGIRSLSRSRKVSVSVQLRRRRENALYCILRVPGNMLSYPAIVNVRNRKRLICPAADKSDGLVD